LKENLKRINPENQTELYKELFKVLPTDHQAPKVPSRFKNFEKLIQKNNDNRRVVGIIKRAKQRIEEFNEIKENLK